MKALLICFVLLELAVPGLLAQTDTTFHPPTTIKINRRPDVISMDEVQATPDARDAYELVRRLRPQFLYVRPTGSGGRTKPTDILVWVNGAERGSLETLRTIPSHAVLEIRKISAADAVTQYGKDQNGVILVRVATGSPPP
jgi:hypothetical protein